MVNLKAEKLLRFTLMIKNLLERDILIRNHRLSQGFSQEIRTMRSMKSFLTTVFNNAGTTEKKSDTLKTADLYLEKQMVCHSSSLINSMIILLFKHWLWEL